MSRGRVRKVCIECGRPFTPRGRSARCIPCETIRTRSRPWYTCKPYRDMQALARTRVGQPCPRCKQPMSKPSVDHLTPIAVGGSWFGPFEIVCLPCNVSKRDRIIND